MKKYYLFILAFFMVAMSAQSNVTVCGTAPDESGNFSCQYIKSGSITWDKASHTLKLKNAVVEYSSDSPYDGVTTIQVTEDATIVIEGVCKVTSTGFVAFGFDSYNNKNIVISGNGSLYTRSTWIDFFLIDANLTIKDITLETEKGIANNGNGVNIALAFDNVQATIKGQVERIGLGITFKDCTITYPKDAYVAESDGYGYAIYCGNDNIHDKIIISRGGNIKGDVNNDGEVNIADVNAVIDLVLGGGNNASADVNNDGEINLADVNAIIDLILGGGAHHDNHEYVDLGLPSGTLWATCNVGANAPEEYGSYFSWGETAPKEVYSWETYQWCNGSKSSITKYCTNNDFGTVDNKTVLELEDDAAYVNWGPSWRMPSKEQCLELCVSCTWQQTTRNGVNGQLVTGPNGQSMFLPAAGERYNNNMGDLGSFGQFWSRTLYDDIDSYSAIILFFYLDDHKGNYGNERYFGFPVRAVRVTQN